MKGKRKALMIIRDGWGYSESDYGNAIRAAKAPNDGYYSASFPSTILDVTGNAVGNPEGTQGGSEVGHLTIGAGRIVWQPYEMINRTIKDGSFFRNTVLLGAIENCRNKKSSLHLSGLFSDQGVHADIRHLFALLELAKKHGLDKVYIHLCLDGRDVPERSAPGFLVQLEKKIKEIGVGKIASLSGRYYGMDRDLNWDRTRGFYDLLTEGKGFKAADAKDGIEKAYARGDKTDYYVQPTVMTGNGKPVALLKDDDSFIWFNFRSDRSKQITAMVAGLDFCTQKPERQVNVHYACFCSYEEAWTLPVVFHQEKVADNLGEALSRNGYSQLRIAETEKYAHVTFFFNSQIEEPSRGEERAMVPSPKVKSYDMRPEMSAYEVTDKLLPLIGRFDFILLNYANPDLVGHSGVFKAVVRACEVVDECAGKVIEKALSEGYAVFLMADHGNADHMLYDDGSPDPSHGFNPIRLTMISDASNLKHAKLRKGCGLKDVAPTVLDVLGIEKPKKMTGESLIIR